MSTTFSVLSALAIEELRRQDPALVPEGVRDVDWQARAVVDDGLKRRVLAHALAVGGPAPLLRIGEGLHRLGWMPALRVLLGAADTDALAQQWMRLERYYHSTHRMRIEPVPEGWRCLHHAPGAAPPGPAEHLLICGVLAGLLAAWGARAVRIVRPPDAEGRWELAWSGIERRPVPPRPWLAGQGLQERVAAAVQAEPARVWSLREMALLLGLSSARSLQRALAAEGTGFAVVQRAARVAAACGRLSDSSEALADIGYACGFADQAHFQRCFRQVIGLTPAGFRRACEGG